MTFIVLRCLKKRSIAVELRSVSRGYLSNLLKLGDVYVTGHVTGHVTARGPPYRYLLRAIEPLSFFLIESHLYIPC